MRDTDVSDAVTHAGLDQWETRFPDCVTRQSVSGNQPIGSSVSARSSRIFKPYRFGFSNPRLRPTNIAEPTDAELRDYLAYAPRPPRKSRS